VAMTVVRCLGCGNAAAVGPGVNRQDRREQQSQGGQDGPEPLNPAQFTHRLNDSTPDRFRQSGEG